VAPDRKRYAPPRDVNRLPDIAYSIALIFLKADLAAMSRQIFRADGRQLPVIAAQAKKDKAVILWLDQTGLRSDAAVGTTWALVGQTPVVCPRPAAGSRST
jgi:hypothetical protein